MANFVPIAMAVLLALHAFSGIVNYVQADLINLPSYQLSALHDLYLYWNHTEDVSSSLSGWTSLDLNILYNESNYIDPCFYNPWRGVFCYIEIDLSASSGLDYHIFDAGVVSISVSDASIVGTLPDSLWNLTSLVSLTLTGNPGLTGHIPSPSTTAADGLYGWRLKSLDLHSNGLSGNLPEQLIVSSIYIEDLNLSNNRLEGPIPASLGLNKRFRTIELSNNTLTGNLPWNLSGNWTNLVALDLSSNKLTGGLPNLSYSGSLHTMNLSHNTFNGIIDVSLLNPNTTQSLATLDLSNNDFTGLMPNLSGWSNLQFLNLSSNSFDPAPFPPWVSSLMGLETLSLRSTSLEGELDLSIFKNLSQLTILELDDNNITGTLNIDDLLRIMGSRCSISLKNNKIGNVIFSSNDVSSLTFYPELLKGNPYCGTKKTDIRRCLCQQICYNTQKSYTGIIVGSAVGGTFVAVMIIILVFLHRRNRREKEGYQKDLQLLHEEFAAYKLEPTAIFPLEKLLKATNSFHQRNKLGEGGFGAVYKGTLEDGSVVAVKQLRSRAHQSINDFLNEVIPLTSVIHKNLVKLKGCCLRGDNRLLVYEFVDNNDLAETLFECRGNQLVTWPARFNICLGVAQGLHYLHAGVDPRIVHRDIKASNVLLDKNLNPKIADFGLAMLFPNELDTHVTVVEVAGSKGYVAPEYATRGRVSDKVDVFSFGVLTLEVVSGRRNISFDVPAEEEYLTDWAWKLNKEGRLMELLDRALSLQNDKEVVEVQRVISTALACIQTAAERRPSMAHVVGMLQGDIQITKSVADSADEHVNYRALVASLSGSGSDGLKPVDEESEVLYSGEGSSSGHWPSGSVEMSAFRGKQRANISGR